MANTINDIYQSIAEDIFGKIQDEWTEACLYVEYYGDSTKFKGLYAKNENDKPSIQFRIKHTLFDSFEELHEIMTENDSNKWNRAVFYLKPTGEFNIDFSWGQELADEIERLNDE